MVAALPIAKSWRRRMGLSKQPHDCIEAVDNATAGTSLSAGPRHVYRRLTHGESPTPATSSSSTHATRHHGGISSASARGTHQNVVPQLSATPSDIRMEEGADGGDKVVATQNADAPVVAAPAVAANEGPAESQQIAEGAVQHEQQDAQQRAGADDGSKEQDSVQAQQTEQADTAQGHNDLSQPTVTLMDNNLAQEHTLNELDPVSNGAAAMLDTPLLPSADMVHIVDSEMDPVPGHDEVLQPNVDHLMIKSELPVASERPIAPLAPPFSLDSNIPAGDALPFTSDGLVEQYAEQAAPIQPATGFAKLEFQDGHFYMTTYAVELGRDMRAYRMAQQYQARIQVKEERSGKRAQRSASVPGTPVRPIKNETAGMSARSFLSESGGIVGEDDGHIKLKKRKKKKSSKSKSTDTSSSRSHSMSRKNSINQPQPKFDYNQAAMQTVDPNATAPLDPMVHMPDPQFTPLIPVHPPMNTDEEFQTGKGISRKHIRISYNFDRCHFEMAVFGRNGAFHDEQHFPAGATVPLHDGSIIQIGGVSLRFVLPTVALEATDHGETDFDSVSGRMSFNFEDGRGESIVADEDDLEGFSSPSARARAHAMDFEDYGYDDDLLDEDEDGEEDDEEDDDEEDEESSEEEETPKKRGPGRPRVHDRKPPHKTKGGHASKTVPSTSKKVPKITLKLSAKDKAREKERARLRLEAEARERERAEAKAKAAKIKAKEAAKAKAKAQAEAEAQVRAKAKKEKEAAARAQEVDDVADKEASKEPSKTPAGEPSSSKEPSAPRIARDAPMQNGEDINVPGLPAGIIIPARKKGPGRPPKDGVMSKRERAQLIKQAKEREKAIKLGLDPSTIPPPENRPPKPKPRRNSQGEEIEGDADGDDEKRPKIPRPPRSPSPEMKIEDYTEEQLQRPSANYVYLIYEAIKNSKAGVMNLQQIYSAIERKYPWYKFKAGSNGWQSSVRHNLGQHEAFKKVEKEGKGWLWGIKEGVPIERERKKKSPPPQPPSHYGHGYPYPQYGHQYPAYPPGQYQQRPPGGPMPPHLQQQGRSSGQTPPGGYQPQYSAGSTASSNQPRPSYPAQGRPQYPPHGQQHAPQQFKRYKPPSAEVIDTFKKVFISTYASRNDNNTAKAEAIVTNAIKRVLEPETMVGIPKDTQEENVMRAFEGILVQSQAPPRQLTPSQPQNMNSNPAPSTSSSMQNGPPSSQSLPQNENGLAQGQPMQNQTLRTELSQTQVATEPSTSALATAQQKAGSPLQSSNNPPNMAANAASDAATAQAPMSRTGTPGQSQSSNGPIAASRPQGPAEANLLGMLMAGPSRSTSNTPIPRSTSPTEPPPANMIGAAFQHSSSIPAKAADVRRSGTSASGAHANHSNVSAAGNNQVSIQPPRSNGASTGQTPSTTVPPNGLGLNISTSLARESMIEKPINGIPRTMTPTRPAVEPLTPPAIASPKVHTAAVSAPGVVHTEDPKVPIKRPRSPEVRPANGEEADAKKAKLDA